MKMLILVALLIAVIVFVSGCVQYSYPSSGDSQSNPDNSVHGSGNVNSENPKHIEEQAVEALDSVLDEALNNENLEDLQQELEK